MNVRLLEQRLLAGLAITALVGGCSMGASPSPSPTATPGASASMAPASPLATPVGPPSSPAAAAMTPIKGTSTWVSGSPGTVTAGADGVQHARGATFVVQDSVNDPRVSGTAAATWNKDSWGTADQGQAAAVQWGTERIENAGGAWEGKATGVYSTDRGDIVAAWYTGTGGYAGLGYFRLSTSADLTAGVTRSWKIRGLVFPGDPPSLGDIPPVTGPMPSPNVSPVPTAPPAPAASAIAYGPTSVVTGSSDFTFYEPDFGAFAAVVTTNDARVSGAFLARPWTMRFAPFPGQELGIGTQWGSGRLENADGTWQGVASGVYDDGGDIVATWYKGTGAYAGMSYFELVTRNDLFGPVTELGYGNFGLIFPGDPPTP
jgi:hypothetical protein